MLPNWRPRAVLKPCLKSETPYIACPDTKLRGLVNAAEEIVRNLVKEKNIQFCWETPPLGRLRAQENVQFDER